MTLLRTVLLLIRLFSGSCWRTVITATGIRWTARLEEGGGGAYLPLHGRKGPNRRIRSADPQTRRCRRGHHLLGIRAYGARAGQMAQPIHRPYLREWPRRRWWKTPLARKDYAGDRQAVSREEAARICGSRAGNMRVWLDQVLKGEFGGVERYLAEKCGFTGEEITRLRDSLIVEVGSEEDIVKVSEIEGWTPDGGVVD